MSVDVQLRGTLLYRDIENPKKTSIIEAVARLFRNKDYSVVLLTLDGKRGNHWVTRAVTDEMINQGKAELEGGRGLDANTVATWIANRSREAGDLRPPPSDYTLLDVSVRYQKSKLWSVNITAYNLFDVDAESASFADIPVLGRNIFMSIARSY